MIAEGGRPEAVIPLSQGGIKIDRQSLIELAHLVAGELAHVSLAVGVDDLHSALLRKEGRNGGTLWRTT
jgi:hypothetical protein